MAISSKELLRVFEEANKPLGIKEILRLGEIHPGQQTEVKRLLRDWVKSGRLEKEGKRFLLPNSISKPSQVVTKRHGPSRPTRVAQRAEGVLHLHPDGFGFVHPSSSEAENIYLPEEEARRAMDHDRVVVEWHTTPKGPAGKLVKVIERRRQMVIGIYRERRGSAWVETSDPTLGDVRVPPSQLARAGDKVKVRLGVGKGLLTPGAGLIGEVSGSLGNQADASVEVLSIAFGQGFHDEFPPGVMDEADAIPLELASKDLSARRDLRSMELVTIDGEDARDFDDAIFVENIDEGWRLVVAIADVSHYVHEGSELDAEALRRATSVYLPGRVLPMLPEKLSNGLCSLKPDEDRLCLVADLDISAEGQLLRSDVYPAVMRSAARCTYTEVHRVLAGEDVPHRQRFKPLFERAMSLSKALTAMRERRGAIDFDLPETRIELDPGGMPSRMVRRDRLESHRLIEECMLAANEAVAKFFHDRKLPCVYRFHGEPDQERLATFTTLAKAYGFHLPAKEVSSKDLNALLEKLEGHPERRALNQLLLRSMMQAVYSSGETGHFGLAAEHYLHFTSPIRRYPDLIVHRLLKKHWASKQRKPSPAEKEKEEGLLEKLAEQSSERERAAMEVERETVSFYACLLMKDRLGEEFEATVSGLTDRGFFVELDTLFIEGLVKGESVEPQFKFDVRTHALVFGSGRRLKVGQPCQVRLTRVNIEKRQMDFELVSFPSETSAPKGRRTSPPTPSHRWEDALPGPELKKTTAVSPHPGFDRLRALASRQGPSRKKPGKR